MSRPAALAVAIAIAATVLRAQFVFFPPGDHSDELIIATLSYRATDGRGLSANWDGYLDRDWSRPTYQFSPYTLVENSTALAFNKAFGFPSSLEDHLRLARWFSVLLGGGAVLVCFFAAKAWFGCARIALVAESLLAIAFLHVQDCCYARVEAMLSLSVLLTFWAAGCVMNAPTLKNCLALGFAIGFTIAVKYNAAPIVLLAAAVWRSGEPGASATGVSDAPLPSLTLRARLLVAGFAIIVGFFLGTPEAVVKPGPLVEGIRYELAHYSEGHPPHQAMDASDGNAKFWWNYFARLGYGWAPTIAVVAFIVASVRLTSRDRLLAAYLVVSMIPLLAAKVRFERNAEVLLGPACIAAARMIGLCWRAKRGTMARPLLWAVAAGALSANAVQHGLALVDFRHAQKRSSSPLHTIPESFRKARYYGKFVGNPPPPDWETYPVLLLSGYSDPFSQRGLVEWRERLKGDWEVALHRSDWYVAGYPFSTVETYHGPGFILRATRKK